MRLKRSTWVVFGLVAIGAVALWLKPSDQGQPRYFRDQTYHHLTLRALGQVPYGGADTGEVLETIKHIRAGNADSWYDAWKRTADRVAGLAAETRDATSRGRALLRAHNYYRSAEFLLAPDDSRRPSTWDKNIVAFYSGLDALGVKYERIKAPFGEHHLNALYFPGRNGAQLQPLIVACGGIDSTLEELYFAVAAAAIERGYSVLLYEGPGQGSVLREQKLTFTPEWEKPTSAVLDSFFSSHPRPSHIVLFGMSLGGYLAPRAAAFDARVDGVVAFDVLFDLAAASRKSSGTVGRTLITWLRANGYDATADAVIRFGMRNLPALQWSVNNSMWTLGLTSLKDLTTAFNPYTLKDVAGRIRGDVLIFAGVEDQFIPLEQVKQFEAALTQASSVTSVVYDVESGGKEHCQDGAITLWQAAFFDWLLKKFPATPS